MDMQVRSVEDKPITIIELAGRFDAYEVSEVKSWFKNPRNTSHKNIIVNLTNIDFIDSSALAALVQGMKRCRQAEGDLHLSGPQPQVRIIFELTRLDKAFEIYSTEEEAIKAFNSR